MNAFDARLIMKAHIRERYGDDVEIIDSQTRVTDMGWLFFYNTAAYIKTGDVMSCLMSNPPCLVSLSGKVIPLSVTDSMKHFNWLAPSTTSSRCVD